MIKLIEGNLLNSSAEIIAHQVNYMGVMNSGVAKQIRNTYPKVYDNYKELCNKFVNNRQYLLGKVQFVHIHGNNYVANMFMQVNYGLSLRYTDYEAMEICMKKLHDYITTNIFTTIAMPYNIGCGRGGGDWSIVENIIRKEFEKEPFITLELWRYNG